MTRRLPAAMRPTSAAACRAWVSARSPGQCSLPGCHSAQAPEPATAQGRARPTCSSSRPQIQDCPPSPRCWKQHDRAAASGIDTLLAHILRTKASAASQLTASILRQIAGLRSPPASQSGPRAARMDNPVQRAVTGYDTFDQIVDRVDVRKAERVTCAVLRCEDESSCRRSRAHRCRQGSTARRVLANRMAMERPMPEAAPVTR